jgi:hypothetical protein
MKTMHADEKVKALIQGRNGKVIRQSTMEIMARFDDSHNGDVACWEIIRNFFFDVEFFRGTLRVLFRQSFVRGPFLRPVLRPAFPPVQLSL